MMSPDRWTASIAEVRISTELRSETVRRVQVSQNISQLLDVCRARYRADIELACQQTRAV